MAPPNATDKSTSLAYGTGREALLAAVVTVVARKGLKGLTFRAVGAEAGVNHTLINHYFGSMQELLAATTEWVVERSIAETGLMMVAESSEEFADAFLDSVAREPELQLFQVEVILASRHQPELGPAVTRLFESYVTAVEQVLLRHCEPADLEQPRIIFAALNGLMLQLLTVGNSEAIRSSLVRVGELLVGSGPPAANDGRG